MTNGLSASDVLALSKGNDGAFDWSWIIGLLVIAGIFSGGFGGFGGTKAGVTEEYVANQFTQRDLSNMNTAMLEGNTALTKDILENRYANQLASCNNSREILSNRYENAIGLAGIEKDILVGNQVAQNQLAECCCGIKSTILEDGQKTRDLINSQYQASLLEKINDLKAQVNNAEQTNNILNTMGRWHSYPSCSCGYGTCNTYSNLI